MSKKLGKLKGKLVLVQWVDSNHTTDWSFDKPSNKPTKCRSVGVLLCEDSRAITVASHISVERKPQRCGMMTIPRKAVTKVTALKVT